MKISTILDHIDIGHMALPEFQRGYVWNRDQVRKLFDSLYKRHPVGGLLVWTTESSHAQHRGEGNLAAGVVKLLLDGQQRMTTIYGIVRGKPPSFFDGNHNVFTGLRFHLESESFEFFQPVKMRDDPLWIDVSELMQKGMAGFFNVISNHPKRDDYFDRLNILLNIRDIDLHIEEVTGEDKTLDIIVNIFNRVNSGGTKLSKGDLALAKICSDWPEARNAMKNKLKNLEKAGYDFSLDWFLRSVNTLLTGEAKFQFLHDVSSEEFQDGLERASKRIDDCLNMIGERLGLDHDRVLFGKYAIPVMVRYLDKRGGVLNQLERDKLLFWFVQSGMWGRFSGSTESFIDQDLAILESNPVGGLNKLLEQLKLWHGKLRVEPDNFHGWSKGARFYPVLYFLSRMGEAKDWGNGLSIRANLLGKMSRLEVHHIFPKSQLYKNKFVKNEVNALANYCFLTKNTNLAIRDRLPEDYFPEIEQNHPGALRSQWIPDDPQLWRIEKYRDFLEERKILLAEEVNKRMLELLNGEEKWLELGQTEAPNDVAASERFTGINDEEDFKKLNKWMQEKALPSGIISFDFANPESGQQRAVFDMAWPSGVQENLTQPVAVLIDQDKTVLPIANQAGFRCFRTVSDFKSYVETEILDS